MSTTEASSASILDRVQSFVSENKQAILIGTAAVIAVGGVAYYASTSSRREEESDLEKAARRKKKSKNGKKSKKTVKDADGPILEEKPTTKPKVEEEVETADPDLTQPQDIESLTDQERTALALEMKARGNDAYAKRKFTMAAKYYTRAIEVAPSPVFYSNRAACYMNFAEPQYENVVSDCDEALKADPMYVKALNRRAQALESLGRYEEALRDYTALSILEKFTNRKVAETIERLIKSMAERECAKILTERQKHLPPATFIEAYFSAFRPRAHPALPEQPSTGDQTLKLALEALSAQDYQHAATLVNEAIEQGISWPEGKAWAYNIRGSFRFLSNDSQSAKADLLEAIEAMPTFTQSWVKIASVYMELADGNAAFEAFEKAEQHDSKDADIFYHKGQVYFIMQDYNKAAECYSRSVNLDDNFVFSQIQLAVAQYKQGNIANSMVTFRKTIRKFENKSEAHNYYGELLLDQQRFQDAINSFDKAIEIEKAKQSRIFNVLAMVNKGLAVFQWKDDIPAAEALIKEALAIDPDCEAAVATLAQISMQRGELEVAAEMFARQTKLARTEVELIAALNYKYASDAQIQFMKNYPALAKEFVEMGRRQQMAQMQQMQMEAAMSGGAVPTSSGMPM